MNDWPPELGVHACDVLGQHYVITGHVFQGEVVVAIRASLVGGDRVETFHAATWRDQFVTGGNLIDITAEILRRRRAAAPTIPARSAAAHG